MNSPLIALAATLALGTASQAIAADVIQTGPAPSFVTAPAVDDGFVWTGFRVGGSVGYAFTDDLDDTDDSLDLDGYTMGLSAGYDAQFGQFVFGLSGEIDYVDLDLRADVAGTAIDGSIGQGEGYVARGLVKAGYAFGNVLGYVQGGYAYTDLNLDVFGVDAGDVDGDGYAVGAGVDLAVTPSLVLGLDYLFHDFDDVEDDAGATGDIDIHQFRTKFAYKF